ncbi:MAG TPA: alkaline phosphatase [Anaerolineae bacterium]|nr:alkaline phosphatase [Anaerolineae bacterium]HQI85145.1 alkaline phosphatase [Anaerolineae bacterium]
MKNKLSAIVIITVAMIGLALNAPAPHTIDARAGVPAHSDVITSTVAPRNVILFIGDGMGPEHVRAAGMYLNGSAGTLVMESFPYSSTMTTYSADNAITDSAAGATAMATGHKVANGVLSVAWPGDESELETLVERFHTYCKRAGLVTTTPATHATPAAFGAHEFSRTYYNNIANDYLTQTRPDVIFGGGGYGLNPSNATLAGYTVILDRAGMQALTPPFTERVSGQFGLTNLPYEYDYVMGLDPGYTTLPHLSEMVSTALKLLENTPNGFFLMVEGGRIDHAGHANDIARDVFEVLEFDHAVEIAYTWAMSRTDTLIIVTADHETGGLQVIANNGVGQFPTVTWTSTAHTAAAVPVYAWGVNADLATQVADNTDIHQLALAGLTGTPQCTPSATRLVTFRSRTRQIGRLILVGITVSVGLYSLLEAHPQPIAR